MLYYDSHTMNTDHLSKLFSHAHNNTFTPDTAKRFGISIICLLINSNVNITGIHSTSAYPRTLPLLCTFLIRGWEMMCTITRCIHNWRVNNGDTATSRYNLVDFHG